MICPCRTNKIYETERVEGAIVVSAIREEWAECYESECPYYICEGNCMAVNGED